MTRPTAVVKVGLMIVGAGETLADAGAFVAGCIRRRSYLYSRQLARDVPYAPPLPPVEPGPSDAPRPPEHRPVD